MPKQHRLQLPLFLAALALSANAFAWLDTGHRVVALVAWEDLSPKTKSAVTALLKAHPRYEKDLLLDAPANQTPAEQDRTAFARAATWPDMVRSPANPMNHVDNHPAWHYIDMPYELGGVTAPAENTAGPGPHNIVEALTRCTADLKNSNVKDADKAVDVCWIEHLAGDIHQPLHAVSLYEPQLPDGDRGGNSDIIQRDPMYADTQTKLHLLWDGLPGDFKSEELCRFEAQGLRNDPTYSREKLKEQLASTDFMAWAKESHQLAIDDVYLNGKLKFAINEGRGPTTQPVPGLPAGYLKNAEHIAMQRLALAGYRLADLLNGTFDPK